MRKFFVLLFVLPLSVVAYTEGQMSDVNGLAKEGLIVDHSQDFKEYRLEDRISRVEAIGIGLKLKGIELPDDYWCQDYFTDVSYIPEKAWICRAVELAANNDMITRSNERFRPYDTVSFTEAMAIISDSQCLIYDKDRFSDFYGDFTDEYAEHYDAYYQTLQGTVDGSIQDWELALISGFQTFNGYRLPQATSQWIHRDMTRGEFFDLIHESRATMTSYLLGCKGQECGRKDYNSCDNDCLRVCYSDNCVGDSCNSECEGGYCTDKRACSTDIESYDDFVNWLPGHGDYYPFCKYDCTPTNGFKRCELAVG